MEKVWRATPTLCQPREKERSVACDFRPIDSRMIRCDTLWIEMTNDEFSIEKLEKFIRILMSPCFETWVRRARYTSIYREQNV